jgi:hypothetical protein
MTSVVELELAVDTDMAVLARAEVVVAWDMIVDTVVACILVDMIVDTVVACIFVEMVVDTVEVGSLADTVVVSAAEKAFVAVQILRSVSVAPTRCYVRIV